MYNFRLKKICNDLSRELHRGADEQIEEILNVVKEEYNLRQGVKRTMSKEVGK